MREMRKINSSIFSLISLLFLCLWTACTSVERKRIEESRLKIKIISPTDCTYQLLFMADSLYLESRNVSYSTLKKTFDTIIKRDGYLMSGSNQKMLDSTINLLLKEDRMIDIGEIHDSYVFEIFHSDTLLRRGVCCDDITLDIFNDLVLPKVKREEFVCDQFFEMLDNVPE